MQSVGRWILGAVATITATAGYLVDWNCTHLQNPDWPPHAKFHDAWTILLGTALGGSALYSLRKGDLRMPPLFPPLFWATQSGSFAFPNTAGDEAEFPELIPTFAGLRLNEGMASALMLTPYGGRVSSGTRGKRVRLSATFTGGHEPSSVMKRAQFPLSLLT